LVYINILHGIRAENSPMLAANASVVLDGRTPVHVASIDMCRCYLTVAGGDEVSMFRLQHDIRNGSAQG
jgi:hypothetical protein